MQLQSRSEDVNDMCRFVEVPGRNVIDAYCAMAERAASARTDDARRIIEAEMRGFRQAVEIYCPDTPGYSCTSGRLIMEADAHMMALEAQE
jgi:hypothetical protein